jgi:pimeloyl-ACP methyl ester carboxylesterase
LADSFHHDTKRIAKLVRAAMVTIGCFLLAAAGLSAWNFIVTKRLIAQNPAPGRFYSVEGRRMYINCAGAGSPAIVIESGLSSDSLGWYGVQRDLARTTRVCAYDRSGLGLSEPRSGPRDAESISHQLHDLLAQAGVRPPYLLVGWSAGGLYVREYARQFPREIAGMALVESSAPTQLDETPGFRESWEAEVRDLPRQFMWERLRVWTGWERLMGRCHNRPAKELESLPKDELARLIGMYNSKTCRAEYVGGELGELIAFEISARQAGRLNSVGNIPLLIVTKDTDQNGKKMGVGDIAELTIWSREQDEMMSLSPKSWHVIAHGSGHAVHHSRPDVLVSEIGRLTDYLRGGPVPPFGTTATK